MKHRGRHGAAGIVPFRDWPFPAPYVPDDGSRIERGEASPWPNLLGTGRPDRPKPLHVVLGSVHVIAALMGLGLMADEASGSMGANYLGSWANPLIVLIQLAAGIGLILGSGWAPAAAKTYAVLFLAMGGLPPLGQIATGITTGQLPEDLVIFMLLSGFRSAIARSLLPIATFALLRRHEEPRELASDDLEQSV